MLTSNIAEKENKLPVFPTRVPSIAKAGQIFDALNASTQDEDATSGESSVAGYGKPRVPFCDGRTEVPEKSGRGHWDFFRFSEHLFMSVTNVRYREDTWFEVPRENVLKIRLVLAGTLLSRDKTVLAAGPAAILCAQTNNSGSAYFVKGGTDAKLVILHCKANMLPQTFGLALAQIPSPFDLLLKPDEHTVSTSRNIRFTQALFRAATDIVDACNRRSGAVRNTYLYAKCLEIIGLILQHLSNDIVLEDGRHGLKEADVKRLLEARHALTEQFMKPPSIGMLAKTIGMNQTKLKFGFKALTGLTVFEFVLRCRMEKAAELLLAKGQNISDVAYEVGYGYPANFTMAFKKYFGYLPKQLRAGNTGARA